AARPLPLSLHDALPICFRIVTLVPDARPEQVRNIYSAVAFLNKSRLQKLRRWSMQKPDQQRAVQPDRGPVNPSRPRPLRIGNAGKHYSIRRRPPPNVNKRLYSDAGALARETSTC